MPTLTGAEFGKWANELRMDYEARKADPELLAHWFRNLKFVPPESLQWIADKIRIAYPDRFPKGFHFVVAALFRDWLNATGKRANEPDCPECDGGWVTIMEAEEMYPGVLIPVAYACGVCKPGLRGVKKLTKGSARRQGLLLVDVKATAGQARDFGQGVKGVLAAMVQKMDARESA